MYEQHFGLKKRPFRSAADGTDVFVGPQIATTMASLKKALATNDAIVAITGPVGCGKTTLVTRTLESFSENHKLIFVARMRLGSRDILALLLDELGVENQPSGTMQQFVALRTRLAELENEKSRVFIVIEDAVRLGADTLAELEALTAADAGASAGASIVLMGDETLDALLTDTQLGRIKQRIRQGHSVAPLSAAELRGYLKHCFRLAGGDFEQLFEANAAPLLHHLCGGIARTTNNLVEATMTAAAEADLELVSSELLAHVAENDFGLNATGFDLTARPSTMAVVAATPVPTPQLERSPQPRAVVNPVPELRPPEEPESVAKPVIVMEPAAEEPATVPAGVEDETVVKSPATEAPVLIQDTLPDLEVLAPEFAVIGSAPPPTIDSFPSSNLEATPPATAETTTGSVPAWDRDPTLAELKPDLAALEQAMAFAHGGEPESAARKSDAMKKKQAEPPVEIPEITLDHAINRRIDSNLSIDSSRVDTPGSDVQEAPPPVAATTATAKNDKADTEIQKIAAELATARSIEDIDERMAETLFGDELSIAAAQFAVKPAPAAPAKENHDVAIVTEQPISDDSDSAPAEEVTLEAPPRLDDGGIDLSASQRLKTVRALNADLHPSLRTPEATNGNGKPPTAIEAPAPIEDQINTSMTQTLRALSVADGDEGATDSGFFGRFKRS